MPASKIILQHPGVTLSRLSQRLCLEILTTFSLPVRSFAGVLALTFAASIAPAEVNPSGVSATPNDGGTAGRPSLTAALGNDRLLNISTRGNVNSGEDVLIVGFIIEPGPTKRVLVRAVGPTLQTFGINNTLADPVLTLTDLGGHLVATNDNWSSSDATAFAAVGAFGLPAGSKDAALIADLPPGPYTALISGGSPGIALAEVYEVSGSNRLTNVSTRGLVTSGEGALIAGVIVAPGNGSRRFLIRAVGPALGPLGVGNVLRDPLLTLTDLSGHLIATNDNWSATDPAVAAATAATHAFAFAADSKDAALVADLPPGGYTALVTSADGTSRGVALVEAYDITSLTPSTGPLPAITSFSASPALLNSAGTVALNWNVTGATALSISPTLGSVTGTSATTTVSATTVFTLTASNSNGQTTATATVTVAAPPVGQSTHPRLWLTPTSLAALRTRASSGDAAWTALRTACDALARSPVEFPDGTGGGTNPISGGYQYYDYLDPMITLGLGYQVAKTADATRATSYAAKGRELLLALSDPVHHGRESTDSGWSIRAYGPALALGYDWLYDQLSAADKVQVYTEINRWVSWFDANGFGHVHPQGNYFAGYYCAKGLGALATEGDNPSAATMWDDWLNRLHYGMVQPYYAQWLSGGGWPEGWNYGPNGTLNMLRPIVAARTAKGLDLLHDAAKPFAYSEGHALWMAHFTWPDLRTVDDRGLIYESDNPTSAQAHWSTEYAGLLRLGAGATAPQMQRYARDVRSATSGKATPWAEFLHWDNTATEADYKTARSYRTNGDGQVAMRSSWATDAVWGGFQSGPYTGYAGAGEQFYDEGSLTIKRGGVQFLVNAYGAFMRNSPGTTDSTGWFDFLYNEDYGTQTDGVNHGRRIFNTFIAVRTAGYWGQFSYGPGESTTSLNHFEDGGSYVVMRGVNLEKMYMTGTPITGWSREVLYLRPNYFLVYDRTATNAASVNQWQGFHVMRTPVLQGGAMAGTSRYDVIDNTGANAGSPLFRGRVSTLLPVGHNVNVVNLFNSSKVYRFEIHPPASANNTWLTVFDASSSAATAAIAAPLTTANGGIVAGTIEGAYLAYANGSGLAALFSTSGAPPALPLSFKIPSSTLNRVVLPDLSPNGNYTVTATSASGQLTVQVTAGTAFTASAQGVLALQVNTAGVVSVLVE